ncbi:MAG: hypothetical protein IKB13_11130 [Clostridia bacterium]|nr:hypothetical protein [Clostridia bacterium]
MNAKKMLNIIGAVIGVIVIILGVVFIATPADSYYTDSADYASFGADFYTYQYQATRDAVTNTAVTANNIRELGEKVALYAGMAFILAGLLIVLYFAKNLLDCCPAKAQPIASPIAAAPAETIEDCAPQASATETEPTLPIEAADESEAAE